MNTRQCALLILAGITVMAQARWMAPEQIPTERVIANLDSRLRENPKDWAARLNLARVYSLAYANPAETTPQSGGEIPRHHSVRDSIDHPPSAEEMIQLRKSLVNYNIVTTHDSKNGLAWLGAGFMLEEAARWAESSRPITFGRRSLKTAAQFKQAALEAYRTAFKLGLKSDFDGGTVMWGIEAQWLSKEAGQSIQRLVSEEKVGAFKKGENAQIAAAIKRSDERPSAITPILFPVDHARPLSELIDSNAKTSFDLAGSGAGQVWPWISPKAAWLAWDPEGRGQITSGRQLFGSATWWMMFSDGYAALSTLDDDHNGWLKGTELSGVVVWHDKNGNARSDSGEVMSAARWGIAGIRTRFDAGSADALTSSCGIVLADGSILPSYDWIPKSR